MTFLQRSAGLQKKLALRFSILALPARERKNIFFLFALAAAELKIRGGNEGGVKLDPSSSSS